ncbi:MAG: hypothetical protein VXZ51_00460 [Actinomycetota bacterium]|nr:hypothetical protein [Actinomycetota bacterium]
MVHPDCQAPWSLRPSDNTGDEYLNQPALGRTGRMLNNEIHSVPDPPLDESLSSWNLVRSVDGTPSTHGFDTTADSCFEFRQLQPRHLGLQRRRQHRHLP